MTDAVLDVDTQNGHAHGRAVPALPTFTFKDSGITVAYRRLGPFTMEQLGKAIRKEKPAPKPPLNTVDYGDGKKANEPNLSDPDYLHAMQTYEAWVETEAGQRMVQMLVGYAIEPLAIDTDAVARYRMMAAQFGLDCEGDDRDVYIKYIAIATPDDLSEITTAVVSRSQPTPGAIQAAVDSFPGDVQGA